MNKTTTAYPAETAAGLEARFGLRVAASLSQHHETGDHDIAERLRVAREQALAKARLRRAAETSTATASAPVIVGVSPSGVATLGGHPADWWGRVASVLPILLMLGALILIDDWHARAQINAAADIDTALLSDDLPPAAYTDPGFAEFLRSPQE